MFVAYTIVQININLPISKERQSAKHVEDAKYKLLARQERSADAQRERSQWLCRTLWKCSC